MTGPPDYLCICAIFCDEAPYLREWVEFHKLVGVQRFFLYDHESSDDWRTELEPYVGRGDVVVRDWQVDPGQVEAYRDCLRRHRDDSRWIAFIDIDEFLFSPTGRQLPDVLAEYEPFPGVGVNWVNFGSSGHVTKPAGLVIESYVQKRRNPAPGRVIKSIVDPRRVAACESGHYFAYSDGVAVDENKRPIEGPDFWASEAASTSLLRINHYLSKSEEEFRQKRSRQRPDTGEFYPPSDTPVNPGEELDETILRYAPQLRSALFGRA